MRLTSRKHSVLLGKNIIITIYIIYETEKEEGEGVHGKDLESELVMSRERKNRRYVHVTREREGGGGGLHHLVFDTYRLA